jgi:hypothetical protein
MNRSSISSSEYLAGWRQFSAVRAASLVFLTAVMLLCCELLLRLPVVAQALPARTYLHEPGIVMRVDALGRVVAQYGHVDVLFVGSSVVRCGIRPFDFDQAVGSSFGHAAVSFNAGLSGLWPPAVAFYLEHLWLPEAHPRVVVQGIRFGELYPSPRARKDSAIFSGPLESLWRAPTPQNRVAAALVEHLRILQYRGTFSSWLLAYQNGRPGDENYDDMRVMTDPRGWTARYPTLDVVRARGLLNSERPYASDMNPMQDALAAIRASAAASRRAGARYILVNVPEHAFRWSAPAGPSRYRAYVVAMTEIARAERFEFIDVTQGDPQRFAEEADYSDYHHMSPAGAQRFTRLLAAAFGQRLAAQGF